MKKIKVLFVSHTAVIGGAEVCLRTLLTHLDKDAFEPVVAFPYDGPLLQEVANSGVKTHIAPMEWWVNDKVSLLRQKLPLRKRVDTLAAIIEKERPNIVHTNSSVICEGALAAKLCGIPHVWHIHEILAGHPGLGALFPLTEVHRLMGELSARVVPVSSAAARQFKGLVDADKLTDIHNGTQLPDPATPVPDVSRELGSDGYTTVAIAVGTVAPEKDYDMLLQATAMVRDAGRNMRLVIVGAGPDVLVGRLHARIEELGLGGIATYLGFRAYTQWLIAAADFLALSSTTESFSLATIEAMAAGKAVIATDCGGPGEIVVDGQTGFLVPVGDAGAMAAKMIVLVDDAQQRREMGARGRLRCEAKFSAKLNAARFEALYREVAPHHHSADRRFVDSFCEDYQLAFLRNRRAKYFKTPAAWPIAPLLRKVKRLIGR